MAFFSLLAAGKLFPAKIMTAIIASELYRLLQGAKTSALKRQVAPNITVRTLPLGTVIVRRKT